MEPARSKNLVYSVEKAFRVLQAFSSREPELLLSEVARVADTDNATAFRMLNTLVHLGYVEKVIGSKRFRLTLKCLDLGFNAIAHMDLRTMARPVLEKLAVSGVGAASIGILDHGDVIYIERLQVGLTRLSVDIRVGTRIPAFCSAIGRAILALLPEDRQRNELERRPRPRLTPTTETDLERLIAILARVRADRIALVDQESVVGLTAIAAPIVGLDRLPIAAISMATASSAMDAEHFREQFRGPLLEAAETLSKALEAAGGIIGGPTD
ncbi:IclR family transcriptional regulator [Prosthecomicrobium sp. N25]|uniref:IclR family transcriptional regulator n=1 Tax=Prosthecomicrobium sp. N25 TaxID=3129254 RepID=UPI0030770091